MPTPNNPPLSEEELKSKLTPEQYAILREGATERAFTGKHYDNHEPGNYHCPVCDTLLFTSQTKFDSGTGWPSFYQPANNQVIKEKVDNTHGMTRTEVVCRRCESHLGHVFHDGPPPTGKRYCINSGALEFCILPDK